MDTQRYVRKVAKRAARAIARKIDGGTLVPRRVRTPRPSAQWTHWSIRFLPGAERETVRAMAEHVRSSGYRQFQALPIPIDRVGDSAVSRGVSVRVVGQYRITHDDMVYRMDVMGRR